MNDKQQRIERIQALALADGQLMRDILLDGFDLFTEQYALDQLRQICLRYCEHTAELRSLGFVGGDPVEEVCKFASGC